MSEYHISVLLQEVLAGLHVKPGGKYIDATLGGGGHTLEITKQGGIVLGIDVDEEALAFVTEKLKGNEHVLLERGNFSDIDKIAAKYGWNEVNGVLFDLGVSSHQFDTGERGFSFRSDAPLDMRMDQRLTVTAKDLVNGLHKGELYDLFTRYGEEHFARRIAENIIQARSIAPITTTSELAKIVERSYPRGYHKVHPATKVFQALRIAVNDELHSLQEALPKAIQLLAQQGRLVVISFHSLEDKIVKESFKKAEEEGLGKVITDKPIEPMDIEKEENPRSGSSKLRIFEKI